MVYLFHESFGLRLSHMSILNHPDMMTYTLTNHTFLTRKSKRNENKVKRKQFVENLLEYQGENIPIVYMDEGNVNLNISRSEWIYLKGSRCSTVATGSKGSNIHMKGAINTPGLINYDIQRGLFKKENAASWLKTCLRLAIVKRSDPVVLVIYNAPCHSNIESVLEEDEFRTCKILRFGSYSPMFNTIENI